MRKEYNTALWVSLLIGLPLFVYILITTDLAQATQLARRLEAVYIIIYLLLSALVPVSFTIVWGYFLAYFDIYPDFSDLFNFRMAGYAISYVTPGPRIGGEITQGSLVSEYTSADTHTGILSAAMESFTMFLGGLVFDTIAISAALILLPQSSWLRIIFIALLTIIAVIAVSWYGFIRHSIGHRIISWFASQFRVSSDRFLSGQITDTIDEYLSTRLHTFGGLVAFATLSKLLIVGQVLALAYGLNTPINIWQAVFLTAAIDIAYSVPSYMGLGVLEAGQTGMFRLFGSANPAGFVIATLTRMRDLIFSAYGLGVLGYLTHANNTPEYSKFKD